VYEGIIGGVRYRKLLGETRGSIAEEGVEEDGLGENIG